MRRGYGENYEEETADEEISFRKAEMRWGRKLVPETYTGTYIHVAIATESLVHCRRDQDRHQHDKIRAL